MIIIHPQVLLFIQSLWYSFAMITVNYHRIFKPLIYSMYIKYKWCMRVYMFRQQNQRCNLQRSPSHLHQIQQLGMYRQIPLLPPLISQAQDLR